MTEAIIEFLTTWRNITRALESALIDNLAASTPWLAPLIPAYLAYRSMVDALHFPGEIAFIGAATVEFLGMSTVATAFLLWDYNDARKGDGRAPVWVAICTSLAYIVVVLTVNVLLDPGEPIQKLAKALLSLLSVVAAITLAIRSNHARRIADIETAEQAQAQAEATALAHHKQEIELQAQVERERMQLEAQLAQERMQLEAQLKREARQARKEARKQVQEPAPVAQPVAQVVAPQPQAQTTQEKVLAFYAANPYGSLTDAGKAVGVSRQRVGQILDTLEQQGEITRNGKVDVKS